MPIDRTQLESGDPLHEGTAALDEARARMRQTVLSSVVAPESPPRAPSTRRLALPQALLASIAVLIVVLAVTNARVWTPVAGGTVVQAAQVRFELRLADEQTGPGLDATPLDGQQHILYLHREVLATNADVVETGVVEQGDRFGVRVELTAGAAERLHRATMAHVGKPMAILLDGRLALAPTLRTPLTGTAVISGDYSREDAERLAIGIAHR